MRKLRTGDEVIIIAGKNKGQRGSIIKMVDDEKLIVENINMVKKHQRPVPQLGTPGGIIEKEAPLHISNVAIYNAAADKADRVGIRTLEDGRKVRFFKSNNEVID